MPSGDQILSSSWDSTIKLWDCSTGFCLKTFKGHDSWVMSIDVNSKGTRMVSGAKGQEIIYWDLNLKTDKSILTIFEEEHENVIDVVIFAPLETAKTIIKARLEQENENEEQKDDNKPHEEAKVDRSDTNGEAEAPIQTTTQKRKEDLDKLRERIAKLKNGKKTNKANEEEEDKEVKIDDIEVKDEFVASGSRDKKIKIWNAKRGT